MELNLDANLEALCFLYLTCGQATDGELTNAEQRQIGANLIHWAPREDRGEMVALVHKVADEYRALPSTAARRARARECAEYLAVSYRAPDLKKILAGLTMVARADGHTSDAEKDFVVEIARIFGVIGISGSAGLGRS